MPRGLAAIYVDTRHSQNHLVNSGTGEVVCTPLQAHNVSILMIELID